VQVVCFVLLSLCAMAECERDGVVAIWISFESRGQVDAASRVCHVLGRTSQLQEDHLLSLALFALAMPCVAKMPYRWVGVVCL
jgi:hypothetical protein